MKILVIGGTGFIGPHVVRALIAGGHEVAVFQRGEHAADLPAGVRQIRGDRRDLVAHQAAFDAFAPEVVIDVILSSGRQAAALMDLFRGRARRTYPPANIKALQAVFGWLDDEYDKIPVERAVLGDAQLPGTVLRLPMVYGPGDPLHRFFPLLKRIDDGRPAILFADDFAVWRGSKGYVENVGAAIALAAVSEKAAGRIYNVANRRCPPSASGRSAWRRPAAGEDASSSFRERGRPNI